MPDTSLCLSAPPADAPSAIVLVTLATWGGVPVFHRHEAARAACRIVHDPSTWRPARCLAWVLMPTSWYGLIETHGEPWPPRVRRLKRRLGVELRRRGREAPVWQRQVRARPLAPGEDPRQAARFLVASPVRAGLVAHVGDYPYWHATWL